MRMISYELAEKRLVELDKIANLKENIYIIALKFIFQENRNFINNVDFQIYRLFVDELQIDFDHEITDRYCKFEITDIEGEAVITAFLFKDKESSPKIFNVKMEEIFSTANDFFKKTI